MLGLIEQIAGALLMALVLLDIFLTMLVARSYLSLFAKRLAHLVLAGFRLVAQRSGPHQAAVLSFCGPTIMVIVVLFWMLGLTVGAALIVQPALGTDLQRSSGPITTDFITALYVGGSSLSVVGSSDYAPQTAAFRLFYLLTSLIGTAVLSLLLIYLMQVYTALRQRNTLALTMHLATAETGDAAELLARLAPGGEVSRGYTHLAEMAVTLASVKEAHHFYPALFFFRFRHPHYAVSRFALIALDTVSLIRSGLDDKAYGWFKGMVGVEQLGGAALMLVRTLADDVVPGQHNGADGAREAEQSGRWRLRYHAGLERLRQAGFQTRPDEEAGAGAYVALRAEWEPYIRKLALPMGYTMDDADPASRSLAEAVPEYADQGLEAPV